jgi:acetylornithine deacetylase/succinyl-diaminopimelate desuccinylase-like protein
VSRVPTVACGGGFFVFRTRRYASGMTDTSTKIAQVDAYLANTENERLADYVEFLRIPSIGTLEANKPDMRAAAEFVAERMRKAGLGNIDISPTPGHPIVYGDWLHAKGAPTVLVYCHYDVQPVDPLDLWVKPPFEPVVENGRIYARGAEDDKGQLHFHLWAAQAWNEAGGGLPLNIKYVFEGEEESGSTNFDNWVVANKTRLAADVTVISDTAFFEGNLPAICVGLRGLMYAQIDVTGPALDLHSGGYGGNVQNPANALATIIAGLKKADGSIDVPGFYDEVRVISRREHEEFAKLPLDAGALAKRLGVPELFGEPTFLPVERMGARPTLDVNGIWGGFQGQGSKTIIPAHAHAKISCRLVPDMDADSTFARVRDRVLELAPAGVRVEINMLSGGRWTLMGIDHAAIKAAAASIRDVFGVDPLYERGGGSIPAAATFSHELGTPVVLLGFANPDGQAHAPNESMRLDNYENGLHTIVRYWERLSTLSF